MEMREYEEIYFLYFARLNYDFDHYREIATFIVMLRTFCA